VDVECKLRRVNFRRVSDPRRAFRPTLGVTGICDDWYRSTMRGILICSGTSWRAEDKEGSGSDMPWCTSNHHRAV